MMSISQNSALFSLLGTTYGGDGQVTFQLPNLQGRVPVHQSYTGASAAAQVLGNQFGQNTVSLTQANMPAHTHAVPSADGQSSDKPGVGLAPAPGGSYGPVASYSVMAPDLVVGSNQPFDNTQPSLVLNFIIALEGIFPSRW
ncbi:phage tail protein [Arthrobacter glacialis]